MKLLSASARARALTRLAASTERGLDLPRALAVAAEELTPRQRPCMELAQRQAREGAGLDEVLSTARLIAPVARPLAQAARGELVPRVLAVLAREAHSQAALRAAVTELLRRPLFKLLGVVALVTLLLVVANMATKPLLHYLPVSSEVRVRSWMLEFVVGGGLAFLVGGRWVLGTAVGRRALEGAAAVFPFTSRLVRLHTAAVLLRTVGVALAAGADSRGALRYAREVFRGRLGEDELVALAALADEGWGVVDCLFRAPSLSPSDRWLLEAAAERADLGQEVLALGELAEQRLTAEARRWGPLFGGLAELGILASGAWMLMGQLLGPWLMIFELQRALM